MSHEERGARRDRALNRTLLASLGLQVATVAAAVLSLPFVTRTLSTAEYGVLATVTGFVALLGFADLGVGASLTQALADAQGRDDRFALRAVVTNALGAAVSAALVVLAIGLVATFAVPWQRLLGAPSIPEATLRACVLALVVSTSAAVVGSMGQRALYGVQRGGAANVWLIAATLAGAACSITSAFLDAPLWVYVLATVGAPTAVSLMCTAVTMGSKRGGLRPKFDLLDRARFSGLARAGGWYFGIAISAAAGYQTDSIVVAAVLGASAAGVYSVALRLVGLITQAIYPVQLQLWPAFGEALVRGDTAWVHRRFRTAVLLSAAAAVVLGTLIVVVGPTLVRYWLTADLQPPRELLLAMAVWTVYSLAVAPVHFLLNAAGRVRAHSLMAIAAAAANVPLSILLTHSIGISGPVYGSLLASSALSGIPGVLIARGILNGHSPAPREPSSPNILPGVPGV
jgi:O-antigen/teichoic acid export membrane protein